MFIVYLCLFTKQNIADQYIDNELPLCFSFSDIKAYIIEENIALTENNKEQIEMYKNFGVKLKNKLSATLLNAALLNAILQNQFNMKKIL